MRTLIALSMLLAANATAAEVVRLTPAERDAVLAAAAMGPERAPVLTPEQAARSSVLDRSLYPEFHADGPAVPDRKVHGEMTMFAGSGGTFGMSGTAIVPVGQNGTAAISVLQGTSNRGGLQGFSLGYASGGAAGDISGFAGYGGGYGGGFGGYGGGFGLWTTPWGISPHPGPPPRRRR